MVSMCFRSETNLATIIELLKVAMDVSYMIYGLKRNSETTSEWRSGLRQNYKFLFCGGDVAAIYSRGRRSCGRRLGQVVSTFCCSVTLFLKQ